MDLALIFASKLALILHHQATETNAHSAAHALHHHILDACVVVSVVVPMGTAVVVVVLNRIVVVGRVVVVVVLGQIVVVGRVLVVVVASHQPPST